ncbi:MULTISPECIES: hypothetical protein [unclassified Microcoleus]|uniref:hypothetical protein n=1 Tax=unclassified Microcoleus TaxID=2642155 RepID=UPI002FD39EC3
MSASQSADLVSPCFESRKTAGKCGASVGRFSGPQCGGHARAKNRASAILFVSGVLVCEGSANDKFGFLKRV